MGESLHGVADMKVLEFILFASFTGVALGGSCDVNDRHDCGHMGTQQQDCEASGCCWRPVNEVHKDTPWCFYPDGDGPGPTDGPGGDCSSYNWSADGPGFTDDFYNTMFENYRANLNVEGCGAVVAAPDGNTPGGSYYYHWMRDAGLSIKAWLDVNDNNYDSVREVLEAYTGWVAKVQQKNDPNGIDVRIEPKFTIPDGEPYTGGWCRPQTDGPALRAMALSKWGLLMKKNGRSEDAQNNVWPLVSFDMAWVTENWRQSGCDLWEEFTSDDFYWNRMAFAYSLHAAADFADSIGESAGSQYRSVANEVIDSAKGHFNGNFIYECNGREKDGSVIHAIITFGEYIYPPSSSEAAKTISAYNNAFCEEYPINQQENGAGKPGILIGRYPGDSYAGGNPWQLLTAAHAEIFYLGASTWVKTIKDSGNQALGEEHNDWRELLYLDSGATLLDLVRAAVGAGDSVMSRLWDHVKDDGGRIDEQIDKYTGAQASAQALTWSYANILHALHTRKNVVRDMESIHP